MHLGFIITSMWADDGWNACKYGQQKNVFHAFDISSTYSPTSIRIVHTSASLWMSYTWHQFWQLRKVLKRTARSQMLCVWLFIQNGTIVEDVIVKNGLEKLFGIQKRNRHAFSTEYWTNGSAVYTYFLAFSLVAKYLCIQWEICSVSIGIVQRMQQNLEVCSWQ